MTKPHNDKSARTTTRPTPGPDREREAEALARWPHLAGRLEGNRHVLPIRVYFEDTDFSGLVYHASYLRFCERGRSDFLRLLGWHHHELAEGEVPAAFAVRRLTADYLKPARIDDVLEVVTECQDIGGASLTLAQEVRRGAQCLMRLQVQVVLLSETGKPMRLGRLMREALAPKRPRAMQED